MIWESLSTLSCKVTLYLDEKENKFLFVFRRRLRHHKALAKLKQQNYKKIHCTKSLLDRITLQTTSRPCLGRLHGKAQWKTFEGLRIKKIKTNKIKLRMMWLESVVHDCNIRVHSSFRWLILRILTYLTKFLWSRVILQTTSLRCFGRFRDYFRTVDNHTRLVFQSLFSNGMKYESQGLF